MAEPKLPRPRIVTIEEESTLRTFLNRLFHQEGWEPAPFASAVEAARQPEPRPAAVVVDMPVEDADAISALDAIQQAWAGVPVLALLETAARADTIGLRKYGASAIVKPFEITMLIDLVRRLVDEGLRTGLHTPRPCRPPRPILW